MAKTHIEVKKNQNENNMSILRRFSRRVLESGSIRKVKSLRYNERPKSKLAEKVLKLRRITKTKEIEKLKKLGKIAEHVPGAPRKR